MGEQPPRHAGLNPPPRPRSRMRPPPAARPLFAPTAPQPHPTHPHTHTHTQPHTHTPTPRNFAPHQAYSALDLPTEMWQRDCYFGASGLAYERLMRAFGYSLVAFDTVGVNVYFVHNEELGAPLPPEHTFASLTPVHAADAWAPLHADCKHKTWVRVHDDAGLANPDFMRHMSPVVLSHQSAADPAQGRRHFYEVEAPGVLVMHRHRRHAGPGHALPPASRARRAAALPRR
jgi:hypothetical protein